MNKKDSILRKKQNWTKFRITIEREVEGIRDWKGWKQELIVEEYQDYSPYEKTTKVKVEKLW